MHHCKSAILPLIILSRPQSSPQIQLPKTLNLFHKSAYPSNTYSFCGVGFFYGFFSFFLFLGFLTSLGKRLEQCMSRVRTVHDLITVPAKDQFDKQIGYQASSHFFFHNLTPGLSVPLKQHRDCGHSNMNQAPVPKMCSVCVYSTPTKQSRGAIYRGELNSTVANHLHLTLMCI